MTKKERQEAIAYAFGSCELEGCIIPTSHREIAQRFIDGEISVEEAVAEMLKAADKATFLS